jgi:hypothetical protein
VQREVYICNKVSISADRLSTHTNFKKNLSLIVRNVRHFVSAQNGEEMMDILVDDIDRYEQLMLQDRLHWFGKRLTCSCYVAYVKFSHNVTFYEKIQISLSSTKFSYCRPHGSPSSSISRLLIQIIGGAFSAK